ncbi:hypothetical protein N9N67_05930 [Bacteriovoracaceae bacterium]|nr:hypothetical protein [Bacteriovoracaceae bacterium]
MQKLFIILSLTMTTLLSGVFAQDLDSNLSAYEEILKLDEKSLMPEVRIVVNQIQSFNEECTRLAISKDEVAIRKNTETGKTKDIYYNLTVSCYFNQSGAPVVMGVSTRISIYNVGTEHEYIFLGDYKSSFARAVHTGVSLGNR